MEMSVCACVKLKLKSEDFTNKCLVPARINFTNAISVRIGPPQTSFSYQYAGELQTDYLQIT